MLASPPLPKETPTPRKPLPQGNPYPGYLKILVRIFFSGVFLGRGKKKGKRKRKSREERNLLGGGGPGLGQSWGV